MSAQALLFFRALFTGGISLTRLIKRKKELVPPNIRDLVIRNALDVSGVIAVLLSTKHVSMSLFMIIFNSKALFIYLFQTVHSRKCPPLSFCVCCAFSFVGMVLVIYPTQQTPESPNPDPLAEALGAGLCLLGTLLIGLADTYLHLRGRRE